MYAGEDAQASAAQRDTRALEQIEYMANRAEALAVKLAEFLARFHGHPPSEEKRGPSPVPAGHRGQLERLNSLIYEIERLTNDINDIG